MPRRAIGISGFDIVAQDYEGAMQLWRIIHQEPARFQAARSLYIQISTEKFDDAEDDQWAMALEAIRPGKMIHHLTVVKIVVVSDRLFEPYSKTIHSSSNMENPYVRAQFEKNNKLPTSRIPVASRSFFAERALIKALSNIRGVEKVEIAGPIEASVKKMLAVAMTTRPGHKVREWSYGGGLRSEDDISWGSWSATMPPTDEAEQPAAAAAAASEMEPFDSQTFLPKQAMQIVTDAKSLTSLRSFGEMARPRLPLDGGFSSSTPDGASAREEERLANDLHAKRADSHLSEGSSETAHDKAEFSLTNRGGVKAKKAGAAGGSEPRFKSEGRDAEGGQAYGSEGASTEAVGMSPPPAGSHEYPEAGGEAKQCDEDVEMEDWERDEEEFIPSDDPDDEDYQD